jgi:hypothetical protein
MVEMVDMRTTRCTEARHIYFAHRLPHSFGVYTRNGHFHGSTEGLCLFRLPSPLLTYCRLHPPFLLEKMFRAGFHHGHAQTFSKCSKAWPKVHKHILEIEGDPTQRQPREVPFIYELFRHVTLEIQCSFRECQLLGFATRGRCLPHLLSERLLAFLDRQTQDPEVDIIRTSSLGEFGEKCLSVSYQSWHVCRRRDQPR